MALPMGANAGDQRQPQTWQEIVLHTVPTSVIEAMATGDVLQIVVFSILFCDRSRHGRRERPADGRVVPSR